LEQKKKILPEIKILSNVVKINNRVEMKLCKKLCRRKKNGSTAAWNKEIRHFLR